MVLTSQQLKQIVPAAKNPDAFIPHLNKYMPAYGINNRERIAAFLAQVAHESGSFNYTREIASGAAYEGRKDLGNSYPGDGVKYKGRGLIQITGRSNYTTCSKALFDDEQVLQMNPDLLSTPQFAVQSACWYWETHRLNVIADNAAGFIHEWRHKDGSITSLDKFGYITLLINGGQNGIDERRAFYKRALTVFK